MKISKNHLRRIIQEELQSVLSEETDLDNLAGEIVRRNNLSGKGRQAWINPKIWYKPADGQDRALVAQARFASRTSSYFSSFADVQACGA